jgi:hypothetical protein
MQTHTPIPFRNKPHSHNEPQGDAGWGGDGAGDGSGKARPKATPAVVLERMDVFTKLHDEDKVR